MALEFIIASEANDSLLWAREYIASKPATDTSRIVSIRKAEKGLLVITEDFKGYIWANSKLLTKTIATLNVFRLYPELSCEVYAKAAKNGAIAVAVDPETQGNCIWQADDDWTVWECVPTGTTSIEANEQATLLPPHLLAMFQQMQTAKYSSTPGTNEQNGAARKGTKAPKAS